MSVTPLKNVAQNQYEPLRSQLKAFAHGLQSHQLSWASGYLAGLADQHPAETSPTVSSTTAATAVSWKIFYATETGNCRGIAEELATQMGSEGLACKAIDLNQYPINRLKKESHALFVLATHGIGEAPEGTEEFFEGLFSGNPGDLGKLHYSVLALGDSSYADFCEIGRQVDVRLEELGGQRLSELVECDLDFDDQAKAWRDDQLKHSLNQAQAESLEQSANLVALNAGVVGASIYSRSQPFPATLVSRQRITGSESTKNVYHLVIEAEGLNYNPGDALGVWPENSYRLVAPIIDLLKLNTDQNVKLDGEVLSLRDALTKKLEITLVGRSFLKAYADRYNIEFLQALLNSGARERFEEFVNTHQIIDVLSQYPASVTAQELVDLLRKISPRLYSIASSSEANPGEVHLTIAEVAYTCWNSSHHGSASGFLCDEDFSQGKSLPVYIAPNPRFALPDDSDTPVIMIGAGTGVAPFRAFLQEREAQNAQGKNWLIFGDRNFHSDFLYQIEWARLRKSGLLTRHDVAFSRDQAEKRYVQHQILENAEAILLWLQQGAVVYVCGDAQHMAPDVEKAFLTVLAKDNEGDVERAEEEFKNLKKAGRYLQDVY